MKRISEIRALWMLLLACVLCFTITGCTSKDDDDDDESYSTRDYIIGVGKWYSYKVKKADGTWSETPGIDGKEFLLEFFDKKSDSNERKFKSWEYINQTDLNNRKEVRYEGVYTVDKKTINCTVDGKPHLRFVVTKMADNELGGTVTFFKENVTFDVFMKRTW